MKEVQENTMNDTIKVYIANAFALGMLPDGLTISVETLPLDQVQRLVGFYRCGDGIVRSIVGHADTAAVFSQQLGFPVDHNRESVTLADGDLLFVGQLAGGRLPEGTTKLPEGFQIIWRLVRVNKEKTYEII